jgi:hypothetical protein
VSAENGRGFDAVVVGGGHNGLTTAAPPIASDGAF